ncbi:hypothetical protein [Cellulomonas sp. NS3]|uniref:hypothetical protein n=1 Tax=Cellulomonas sp. NS3 TaxID=2973977 RepID=UPI002161FD77|nr:hypothetical protein [Cellulomonas sp. NS3]
MRPLLRALEVLSALETVTVLVLLGNLATVHADAVTSTLGPVHGSLYLAVATTALLGRDLLPRTRVLALVPAVGGVLTLVNVRREARR